MASLAHPGGNATGFTLFEFGISAKWLELLKEIAPDITRVAVIRDPTARSGGGQLGAIQGVAPSLGVEVRPIDPDDTDAIKHDLVQFAREPRGGLIVTTSRLARAPIHRQLILTLAAEQRLPAIYAFRVYAVEGGLMAYSPSAITPFRRAAAYVDRILKGEKPADLPVQAPTKYELTIKFEGGQGTWPHGAIVADHSRRRGDRISCRLLHCMSLLLAQSGYFATEFRCPLLGVKRTLCGRAAMSAFDPKRTSAIGICCDAQPLQRCGRFQASA